MKPKLASRKFLWFCVTLLFLPACTLSQPLPVTPSATFTSIPTLTPVPSPTFTPPAALGTIALDFVSLLCNSKWANGVKNITSCPGANADYSGGFAATLDPTSEGMPAGTPILLTIPAWNGASSLFLRYPSFTVGANDRFRATLQCRSSMPCNVEFALEYYDNAGKYHSPFLSWDTKSGDAPIPVNADLSALAGQTVDFVLTLRLFHALDNSQQDNGLWIAPHIYRPLQ
jgi:hypothetical protein